MLVHHHSLFVFDTLYKLTQVSDTFSFAVTNPKLPMDSGVDLQDVEHSMITHIRK